LETKTACGETKMVGVEEETWSWWDCGNLTLLMRSHARFDKISWIRFQWGQDSNPLSLRSPKSKKKA
jgi:hypothetical protein